MSIFVVKYKGFFEIKVVERWIQETMLEAVDLVKITMKELYDIFEKLDYQFVDELLMKKEFKSLI